MADMNDPDSRLTPSVLVADDWKDYALLDSGEGRKLERYGSVIVDRPDPQAFWPKALAPQQWQSAHAAFAGGDESDESGRWRHDKPIPDSWPMQWDGIKLNARLAAFRHLGVFPEHSVHWRWAQAAIQGADKPQVLNLFGYTGMASLALAKAGAAVTHVDASKKSRLWPRKPGAIRSGFPANPLDLRRRHGLRPPGIAPRPHLSRHHSGSAQARARPQRRSVRALGGAA